MLEVRGDHDCEQRYSKWEFKGEQERIEPCEQKIFYACGILKTPEQIHLLCC